MAFRELILSFNMQKRRLIGWRLGIGNSRIGIKNYKTRTKHFSSKVKGCDNREANKITLLLPLKGILTGMLARTTGKCPLLERNQATFEQ